MSVMNDLDMVSNSVFREIGQLIARVVDGLRDAGPEGDNSAVEEAVKKDVIALTGRFPIYGYLG